MLGVIALIVAVVIVIRVAWGSGVPQADHPPVPSLAAAAPTDGSDEGEGQVEAPAGPSGGEPAEDGALSPQLEKIQRWGLPVYCAAGTKPLVALTFDDGPGAFTPKTLNYLKQQHIPATFFVVGKLFTSSTNEKLAVEEARFGEVASHSQDHIGLAGASASTLVEQIDRPERTLEKITGIAPLFFRPPLGSHDAASDRHVADLGMITVIWSLESTDSLAGMNADDIVHAVDKGLSAGDIVLMHENRGTTQTALPQIVEIMRERGLTPVTLSELLTQDPPTRQQVKNGDCG